LILGEEEYFFVLVRRSGEKCRNVSVWSSARPPFSIEVNVWSFSNTCFNYVVFI
jgi:hypothetical protein